MSRYERCVNASFATAKFEQFLVPVVQGLGYLDTTLIKEDQIFLANFEAAKHTIEASFKLSELFTLSYLWVFGTYELVRTICQRINTHRASLIIRIADKERKQMGSGHLHLRAASGIDLHECNVGHQDENAD
jgi:hypothetical protein